MARWKPSEGKNRLGVEYITLIFLKWGIYDTGAGAWDSDKCILGFASTLFTTGWFLSGSKLVGKESVLPLWHVPNCLFERFVARFMLVLFHLCQEFSFPYQHSAFNCPPPLHTMKGTCVQETCGYAASRTCTHSYTYLATQKHTHPPPALNCKHVTHIKPMQPQWDYTGELTLPCTYSMLP